MLQVVQAVTARGDDLCLERLERPRARHFRKAAQVLVERQVVDDREAAVALPDDLELSPVSSV
jgi:hypothetical protein